MIEVYLKDTKLEILNTADLPSGKKFKSRFIQPGLAGYPQQYGNVLITKESLDKFVDTLEGKPVIINHQEVTTKNVADIEVGRVHNVWFNDEDGWYWCDGVLTSQNAIDLINDGYSVSCSYNVSDFTDKGGTVNNIKYDMEFLDGVFTHLAIVNNPRYEDAEITVINSIGDDIQIDNDKWITVHPGGNEDAKGVHVLVKDGETEKDAIERLDKNQDKSDKGEAKKFDLGEKLGKLTLEEMIKKGFKPIELGTGSSSKGMQTTGYALYDEENKNNLSNYYRMQKISKEEFERAKGLEKKQDKSEGGDKKTRRDVSLEDLGLEKTLEGGIKETQDTYGRTTFTKGNKWANISKNGGRSDSWIAAYGLTHPSGVSWEREKGITEEQLLHSKGFKTEKGARKWALEQLKRLTSDNSLTNTIVSALAEVIAENCMK